jgi:hypothetical protein
MTLTIEQEAQSAIITTVGQEAFNLSELSLNQLEDLWQELFNQASEASDRRNRHGWQGGEDAYRKLATENFQARVLIQSQIESLKAPSSPLLPSVEIIDGREVEHGPICQKASNPDDFCWECYSDCEAQAHNYDDFAAYRR